MVDDRGPCRDWLPSKSYVDIGVRGRAAKDGARTAQASRHSRRARAGGDGQSAAEEFVPENLRNKSYWDSALPIGHDQTISQPFIVAFMTEQLRPQPTDRVLEIGTGTGYQTAVLAELVKDVYTIEIIEPLAKDASARLARLDYNNAHVKVGDGYQGWPDVAPFDAIIVTCAPDKVPQPLTQQLKEGGRIIIPVGNGLDQQLFLLEKKDGQIAERAILPVRFVEMTGEAATKK